MSRYYEMYIQVDDIPEDKVSEIIQSLQEEWFSAIDIQSLTKKKTDTSAYLLSYFQEGSLCGGETEEEFVDRITYVAWNTCKCFVPVEIRATCLDNLPYEDYELDEEDYAEYIKGKEEAKSLQQ